MELKPLRTVNEAREDVLSGGLTDNHFAAQLDKIVRAPQDYPVYGDATEFFAITYPTAGLHTLLSKSFGRVTGAKGVAGENGVLRPTTSFGGGKTHGLAAVYHLAIGARPDNLAEFIDPSLLPAGPVQVAALVGDALDPVAGVQTNGSAHLHVVGRDGRADRTGRVRGPRSQRCGEVRPGHPHDHRGVRRSADDRDHRRDRPVPAPDHLSRVRRRAPDGAGSPGRS